MVTPPNEVFMWIRRFLTNALFDWNIPEQYVQYSNVLTKYHLIQVLVLCVGASVGLAFMWWGVKKLVRALLRAFKHGTTRL